MPVARVREEKEDEAMGHEDSRTEGVACQEGRGREKHALLLNTRSLLQFLDTIDKL
jgi:hypothetical protein